MPAAGLLLFSLVGYLLVANFRSASTIRESLLRQHSQRVHLAAASLGHFLDSASRDLRNVADSREVASFFENRDLGMSMEYGLALSLVPIRERLVAMAGAEQGTEELPFARVALLDTDGSALVDSAGPGAPPWTEPLEPSSRSDGVRLSRDGRELLLVRHHAFKGRHVGHLVAWIRPSAALAQVSGRSSEEPVLPGRGATISLLSVDDRTFRGEGEMVERVRPPEGAEAAGESIATRVPVPGHALTLLEIDRASSLMGNLSPARTAVSLTIAAAVVLAVVLLAVFFQTKALILRERLDASLAREKEVGEKHRALEAEMAERRRQAEARALLAQAVDQAVEGIALTDVAGRIEYGNLAFATLMGIPAEGLPGRTLASLYGDEDDAVDGVREALGVAQVWRRELTVRRADGSSVDAEVIISPVRDGNGRVAKFVSVARDVTEEQRLRAQLRHAQKLDAVGKLAGGVAHDFNNLLSVIISYADFALESLEPGHPLQDDITEIRRAGRRAAELTRQLLAFSRKQVLNPAIVDAGAVVTSIEKMLSRVIGAHVELVTSTSPGLWRTRVDPGQLEQVIVNLTVNARDAMPGGGRLVISTSNVDLGPAEARAYTEGTSGRYVRISVSDSGVGMTSSILAHLFEPFFTTKDVGKGTGLGLSTVYGIVHQSHGFIHAESEPGHGSTFHVFLPAEFPPDAAIANLAAAPQATTQMPRASDETVLVVEDEQQLRALLETRLASEGFRVLTAADGQEALEVAAQHPGRIDVLVSDIVMPRMGGLQMAGPFRDRHPDALVVFMSGYSDEAVARSIELGQAAAFVQKPEHVSGLPTLLRQLLDGRGKHQGAPGVA